jgi:hypothetical protein
LSPLSARFTFWRRPVVAETIQDRNLSMVRDDILTKFPLGALLVEAANKYCPLQMLQVRMIASGTPGAGHPYSTGRCCLLVA